MSSLREKILNCSDIKEETIEIKEWGCSILIRGLSGKQRAKLLTDSVKPNGEYDLGKMYPDLTILSCYDPETKEQIFMPTDREAVAEKSGGALEKICMTAMKLSGIDKEALGDAKKN